MGKKLSAAASINDIYKFSFDHVVAKAKTIDVIWFNERNMPASVFEVEHSTDLRNALLKFVELQDFSTKFRIVADAARTKEFQAKLSLDAFRPISDRVKFWTYEEVADLHSKTSAFAGVEAKLEL